MSFIMSVCVAVVCYGVWGFSQKLAVRHMTPVMVELCICYVYSAIAPILFLYVKSSNIESQWNTNGVLWSTLSTVAAIIGGIALLFSLEKADAGLVNSVVATYPILIFVMSVLFLGESISLLKCLGVLTIVTGLVLISK